MTPPRPRLESKKGLLESDLELATIEASEYFVSLALCVRWYSYDDLKEISDLRSSTTAIGHLPIRLLTLLAADVQERKYRMVKLGSPEPEGYVNLRLRDLISGGTLLLLCILIALWSWIWGFAPAEEGPRPVGGCRNMPKCK